MARSPFYLSTGTSRTPAQLVVDSLYSSQANNTDRRSGTQHIALGGSCEVRR